ncbi:hypothetical protein ABEB36_003280 [Hypothenemus hampei]|uniref:Uncharacterized protein n=1 Tax=Hypothenemus hampei TaxID=57062 RepID=A0ABD1F8M2_HYPHA
MKFFIAILLSLAFAMVMGNASDEAKEKIKAANQKCQGDPKTAVDKTTLKAYIDSKGTAPAPENIGAHALCVSKELNWQNADGSVNREHLKERISAHVDDASKVDEILNECAVVKDNEEATARHLFRCFYKYAKDHGH